LFLTLRKEYKLKFKMKVLRRLSGPKRDEKKTGGWRKLHNEKLHNLCSSPNLLVIQNRKAFLNHNIMNNYFALIHRTIPVARCVCSRTAHTMQWTRTQLFSLSHSTWFPLVSSKHIFAGYNETSGFRNAA
jgi:hypothetical protein